jgi:hypothetical protein
VGYKRYLSASIRQLYASMRQLSASMRQLSASIRRGSETDPARYAARFGLSETARRKIRQIEHLKTPKKGLLGVYQPFQNLNYYQIIMVSAAQKLIFSES